MNDRLGIFDWLARLVSAFVGVLHTPKESTELREEIAAGRAGEQPSEDPVR